MALENNDIDVLMAKYLEGTATDAEMIQVLDALDQSDELREIFDIAVSAYYSMTPDDASAQSTSCTTTMESTR